MRAVRTIEDELYRVPPAEFTAIRNRYVAQARQAGDRAGAAALASLRRPSRSAWLVNLLALERPQALARLADLGTTLRAAYAGASSQRLRELAGRRRREIQALLSTATRLAAEAGHPVVARHHLAEVESTLAAALADEDVARQVRAGRLVKGLGAGGPANQPGPVAGVLPAGPAGRAAVEPAAAAPPAAPVDRSRPGPMAPAADVTARRAAAEARLAEAHRVTDAAVRAERDAQDGVERIAAQIGDLRHRLDAAQRDARAARRARRAAERELAIARRSLAALEADAPPPSDRAGRRPGAGS